MKSYVHDRSVSFCWITVALVLTALLLLTSSSRAASLDPNMSQTVLSGTSDTTITLNNYQIADFDAFIAYLDKLPSLKKVDMFESEISTEQMAMLSERYPSVSFGWTLHIGDHILRTNATAFSTLHNRKSTSHTSEDFAVLRYCKDLLALDVGHNAITDISFLESLPKLKILILGRNRISDTTPIGKLVNLEYLELFSDSIVDITALSNCTKLMDLNITNNHITDLSPVLTLPNLQRLWIYRSTGILPGDRFPTETKQTILSAIPASCKVNFSSAGTGGGWRKHSRYNTVYEIFNSGMYRPWDE